MIVITHKSFNKDYKKKTEKIKIAFKKRRDLFLESLYDKLLNNHKLNGKYEDCRSINISGDIRAVFYENKEVVTFIRIGAHSELYE